MNIVACRFADAKAWLVIVEAAMTYEMEDRIKGGCRCSAIRFEITCTPMLTSACHCTGCQRMTGSAFALTVSVPSDGFAVTKGMPVIGGIHGPNIHHHHCDACKSWVYTTIEPDMGFINVRTTMLDEPGDFAPMIDFWISEKLPWIEPSAKHRFETQPEMDAYGALLAENAARDPG